MMPMVFMAVVPLSNDCENLVFIENCSEEGQANEKETDAKEERDIIETLVFHEGAFSDHENSEAEYFTRSKELVSTSKDVLTQPPEFI